MFHLGQKHCRKMKKDARGLGIKEREREMKSKLEAVLYRILIHLEDYSFQSFGEFSKSVLYSFLLLQY